MPISFQCPHCGHTTEVAQQYAGQTGPCAHCGQPVTIPGAHLSPAAESPPARSGVPVVVVVAIVGGLCVVGLCVFGILGGLLLPAITSAREKTRQGICLSNMRQAALAMHQYENIHQTFPPSRGVAAPGSPPLSWRTRLLPHLDMQSVFSQYQKDEPWDSPANRKIGEVFIELYRCPSDATNESPPQPLSNQIVVNGETCIFHGPTAVSSQQISAGDGAAMTILLGETFRTRIKWPEPRDLEFNDVIATFGSPQASFDSQHPNGLNVIFADGHGQVLDRDIDPEVLRALFTYNGNELISGDMHLIK